MSIVEASKGNLVTITASAAVKPCQGDSFEIHLITGNQVTRSMLRKISSLQVMSKDEYDGKKCSSQEVSKIISRIKIKISSLQIKISSQRSRSKITSMQKELQKNFQEHKASRFKTSQEVKPQVQ
ncbi:hypothetical protein Tco_1306000 [Tanacetum coccineum]